VVRPERGRRGVPDLQRDDFATGQLYHLREVAIEASAVRRRHMSRMDGATKGSDRTRQQLDTDPHLATGFNLKFQPVRKALWGNQYSLLSDACLVWLAVEQR
jgi:hypothetical protein